MAKQVKKTTKKAIKSSNTITVKNAKGDADTTATLLIQNKIDYTPKVSVIIPVYNVEKYLAQCLDSVINQTLHKIEIICVNDGSTDKSLEILKEYAKKDNRIAVVDKPNNGLGAARNTGIRFAKAPYLYFIDSDDWINLRCLESLYKKIIKTDSELCIFGLQKYDESKHKYLGVDTYFNLDTYKKETSKKVFNYKDIKNSIFVRFGAVLKMYKKDFFERESLFFTENVYFEDVFTHVKAILSAKSICIYDECFYFYRINTGNSIMDTSKHSKKCLDIFIFIEQIYNYLKNNKLYDDLKIQFLQFIYEQVSYNLARITDNDIKKDLYTGLNTFINKNNLEQDIHLNAKLMNLMKESAGIKVSVIIPVYNTEKYLPQCLDSVINQTLKEIEIICVNDGSTDNSLEILKEYTKKDNRIKIINQQNQGQGVARNNAMHIAIGEYFNFLDSDDYLKNNALEILYDCCKKNDLDMLSFSGNNFIDGTNNMQPNTYWDFLYLKEKICFKKLSFHECLPFMKNMAVSACITVYKRSFIQQNNIFFPDGLFFEDNVFFYKSLTKAKNIGLLNEKLYCRRVHPESVTQNRSKYIYDFIRITDLLLDYLKSINLDKKAFKIMADSYLNYCVSACKNNSKIYGKMCNKLLIKYKHVDKKNVDFKSYILFPYYLLANICIKIISIPVVKFIKHTRRVLYSHSARGRMDKILQSITSVKDCMENQINTIKIQQNDLIKQVNNNITNVKKNSQKEISKILLLYSNLYGSCGKAKYVKLMGGIGNQMFQYAFGVLLSRYTEYDISWFDDIKGNPNITQREYELDFWNVESKLVRHNKKQVSDFVKLDYITENPVNVYDENLLNKNNAYFTGYFQVAQYYDSIRQILLKDFTPKNKPNKKNQEILDLIHNTNSVSLHVRRGDYVKLQHIHGLCNLDYYKKAINFIASKQSNLHFFLFSDDIQWVIDNLKIDFPYTIVDINHNRDSAWDMWLMANCKHNIIANSSFSWWGAWLNQNPDKIVIAPKQWLANNKPTDIVPKEWKKI